MSFSLTLNASDTTGHAKLRRRDSGKHAGQMRNIKSNDATPWKTGHAVFQLSSRGLRGLFSLGKRNTFNDRLVSTATEAKSHVAEISPDSGLTPALTPNDFDSLAAVEDRLLRFQQHYERAARPFQWKLTRRDLVQLLARLKSIECRREEAA